MYGLAAYCGNKLVSVLLPRARRQFLRVPFVLIIHLHMLRSLTAMYEHRKCFMNKFVIQFGR